MAYSRDNRQPEQCKFAVVVAKTRTGASWFDKVAGEQQVCLVHEKKATSQGKAVHTIEANQAHAPRSVQLHHTQKNTNECTKPHLALPSLDLRLCRRPNKLRGGETSGL